MPKFLTQKKTKLFLITTLQHTNIAHKVKNHIHAFDVYFKKTASITLNFYLIFGWSEIPWCFN